jgi:hypothetical protein
MGSPVCPGGIFRVSSLLDSGEKFTDDWTLGLDALNRVLNRQVHKWAAYDPTRHCKILLLLLILSFLLFIIVFFLSFIVIFMNIISGMTSLPKLHTWSFI